LVIVYGAGALQGFQFTPTTVIKIPKFTVDRQDKTPVKCSELSIVHLYRQIFCVYCHSAKQEIILYELGRDAVVKRMTFPIPTNVPPSIHTIDNLLIFHHPQSKVSMICDIKDLENNSPIAPPLPLPFPSSSESSFQFYFPSFVLDTGGILWDASLDLVALSSSIPDKRKVVDVLSRRINAKSLLLTCIRNAVHDATPIQTIASIFDMLSKILHQYHKLNESKKSQKRNTQPSEDSGFVTLGEDVSSSIDPRIDWKTVVDQSDIYKYVFAPVEDDKGLDFKFVVAVVTEYIRSLNFEQILVEPFLFELLINLLVRNNRFSQLHQFLQYHAITDSVHVACQLLSLETTYPPAYQLALDMLKRLHTHDQIVEVLLTKKQFISALRFVIAHKNVKIPAGRFLEEASVSGDIALFYTVYKFFEQRNEVSEKYTNQFNELFTM